MRPTIFLGLALVLASSAAAAEPTLLRVPVRMALVPVMDAGDKPIAKGDTVFTFPLRWEEGARMDAPVAMQLDERRVAVAAGDVLARTEIRFDEPSLASAKTYCVPRRAEAPGAGFGLMGALLARGLSDGQFCLIDGDTDGRFDHAVMVNAGSAAARTPRAIAPIAYRNEEGAEVGPGDQMRIRYHGGRVFTMEVSQQGKTRAFTDLRYQDAEGPQRYSSRIVAYRMDDGRFVARIPGMELDLTPLDPRATRATLRWQAKTQPSLVPFPDEIIARPY